MKPYIVEPFPNEFRVIKLADRAHESLQLLGAPVSGLSLVSMFPSLEEQGDAELDVTTFSSLADAQKQYPDAEVPGLTRWFPAPCDLPRSDRSSRLEADDPSRHPESVTAS